MEAWSSRIKNRIDGVMILLLFFVFFLSLLFLYLQHIDERSKNYYNYKKTVEKLHLYNQQLDSTFIRSYRYLDNDKITHTSKMFEVELEFLQNNELTQIFGIELQKILLKIADKYNRKIELVESFKTLNARITSSVYYLYELSRQIKNNGKLQADMESLLSNILFKIGQVFLDTDIDALHLKEDLKKIGTQQYRDEDLVYFYKHVEQFLQDVKLIQKILVEQNMLNLDETINRLNQLLEKEYLQSQKQEDRITLIFFIFAFIILIVLINTYFRVLRKKEEVNYLAYHDTLTHLPNRTEFERYISGLIEKKSKGMKAFAILFIDLDRFKGINDTLGHDIGDKMLIILSKRICKVIGEKNFLARIGGDEFVALIERKKDIKKIEVLVEEVASAIREPIQIKEYSLNTTASIGIARYPKDGRDKSTLLRHADSAMYHAKDMGKDTYAFYSKKLSVEIERRLKIEQELVYALKRNEFSVSYQPQYRLDTKEISGVEALIRWHNKMLGNVSPEEFITVAEDTGLIVELGYYIFREACKTYMAWKEQGVHINFIAINMSSVQLRQYDAFEKLKAIIEETGIDAKHIELELTERYIMEYTTDKLTILDDLRALGCRISIDDFGTGYSSMSYLRSLSIDTIKIDKSFIVELPYNKQDVEVSQAIIVLSQSLGYEVIAEGIETLEQEQLLQSFHCEMGQGYYFAKPMSSEKIVSFYHEKQNK